MLTGGANNEKQYACKAYTGGEHLDGQDYLLRNRTLVRQAFGLSVSLRHGQGHGFLRRVLSRVFKRRKRELRGNRKPSARRVPHRRQIRKKLQCFCQKADSRRVSAAEKVRQSVKRTHIVVAKISRLC